MMSRPQRFGLHGEKWVLHQLQQLGYEARLISDWLDTYDIIVDDCVPVEVKISHRLYAYIRPGYYRPRYQFCVSSIPTDIDSVVILVCCDPAGCKWPYIVPSGPITQRQTVSISSHPRRYNGWLAGYLFRWDTVDDVKTIRRRLNQSLQLPLIN